MACSNDRACVSKPFALNDRYKNQLITGHVGPRQRNRESCGSKEGSRLATEGIGYVRLNSSSFKKCLSKISCAIFLEISFMIIGMPIVKVSTFNFLFSGPHTS